MDNQLEIHRNRTNFVLVNVGVDVSNDTITSQIRAEESPTSEELAVWDVSFVTDGEDGELLLKLDNSVVQAVEKTYGYMDLKRVSGGEPLSVFDKPLKVIFKGVVTA